MQCPLAPVKSRSRGNRLKNPFKLHHLLHFLRFFMMKSLSQLRLLYALSTVYPCSSLSTSTVQVDILFPQNNTVYKPVHPFPVIFNLYNLQNLETKPIGLVLY
jgi:hypothetical protein